MCGPHLAKLLEQEHRDLLSIISLLHGLGCRLRTDLILNTRRDAPASRRVRDIVLHCSNCDATSSLIAVKLLLKSHVAISLHVFTGYDSVAAMLGHASSA